MEEQFYSNGNILQWVVKYKYLGGVVYSEEEESKGIYLIQEGSFEMIRQNQLNGMASKLIENLNYSLRKI